jgi:hypothetical protein
LRERASRLSDDRIVDNVLPSLRALPLRLRDGTVARRDGEVVRGDGSGDRRDHRLFRLRAHSRKRAKPANGFCYKNRLAQRWAGLGSK